MAAVTPTIQVGFIGPGFDNRFKVGDPVWGRLDNFDARLDGTEVLADLTDRCVSLSVTRGRSESTQPFQAGSCSLTFRNEDGLLDPENVDSEYYPGVLVGRSVVVEVDALPVFRGVVQNIGLSYSVSGEALFTVDATDALSQLAVTNFAAGTVFGSQTSGARINSVLGLASVGYGGTTNVSTGQATLAAETTASEQNALAYLQAIERSEDGFLFVAADGVLTFRDRHEVLEQPVTLTFSDDGIDLPYQQISRTVPINELYNRLSATVRATSNTVTVDDTDSQASFGIRATDLGDLLLPADADVSELLSYVILRTRSSRPRVTQVATLLDAFDDIDRDDLLGLELGDPVVIEFTPPGMDRLTINATVESIQHDAAPGSGWTLSVGFAPRNAYFLVGDATYGRLDFNALAY